MNAVIHAVFVALCIRTVYCQMPTNISNEKSIKVYGATEILVCTVMAPMNDLNITWVKDNKGNIMKPIVLTYGNEVAVQYSRFSLQVDTLTGKLNGNRYTLTISDLEKSDAGSYRCQAIHQSENIIFAKLELEMREPKPATIFNNITSMVVVLVGRRLKLECHAYGFPEPVIYWSRENDEPLFTGWQAYRGSILETPAARRQDRGNYYCFAENGIRPSPKRIVGVTVEFPPVVTTSQQIHGQALHSYVNLDCHIEACPSSNVIWTYKEVQLFDNQYYKITNIATSSKVVVNSILRINTTEKHVYGDYVCKTHNIFGAAEVTIKLYETTRKMCPPGCE